MVKKVKLGLAIGGGAALGLSAIGVLKVFEEHNIPIDVIAGTSIGSIIGGLYAYGYRANKLEELMLGTNWDELIDFTVPSRGLVSGSKVENLIKNLIGDITFDELQIPMHIVAVDINEGKTVIFNKGSVATAIRASIAIPGVFNPVEFQNMILVDGGVTDPVPVDVIKKHADKTIAIDFSRPLKRYDYVKAKPEKQIKGKNLMSSVKHKLIETELQYIKDYINQGKIKIPFPLKWLFSPKYFTKIIESRSKKISSFPEIFKIIRRVESMMSNELTRAKFQLYPPDILINPLLSEMDLFDFDKGKYAINQGENEAKRHIKAIEAMIKAPSKKTKAKERKERPKPEPLFKKNLEDS